MTARSLTDVGKISTQGVAATASWAKGNTVKSMKESIASREAGTHMSSNADPLGVNTEIGRKLKQYYDELVSDDVPDRFSMLLAQLEAAESAQKGE